MMNNDIEFDNIGKQTPFRLPEGYLNSLQQDILKRNAQPANTASLPQKRVSTIRLWTVVASAACIAFLIAGSWMFSTRTITKQYTIEDIDMYFAQLSEDDQQFLLDIYDDIDFEDYLLTPIDNTSL